jgi:hypothetical protein
LSDERDWKTEYEALQVRWDRGLAAVQAHHGQKADDRCVEDDTLLYAAFDLPPADVRVGDKDAMLENCRRFIERRCEGGGWPTYAALEAKIKELEEQLQGAFLGQIEIMRAFVTWAQREPNKAIGTAVLRWIRRQQQVLDEARKAEAVVEKAS